MDYLAVAIASFFGAVTRDAIDKFIGSRCTSEFPFTTLFINMTGCFMLSFFLTVTVERLKINSKLRLSISTGFIGTYTTFSGFVVETVHLVKMGNLLLGLFYFITSTLGCVVLAWAGYIIGQTVTHRRHF